MKPAVIILSSAPGLDLQPAALAAQSPFQHLQKLSPSPGTPGEGRGGGDSESFKNRSKFEITLTPSPSPSAGRGVNETGSQRVLPHVLTANDPRGYGAALAIAFSRAAESGCTHAVVLDVGRGHDPKYLPEFIEAAGRTPGAIIVGVRQYYQERPSLTQRFGRWNCDFWTWAETGRWVHDTVYGFKSYPLSLVGNIAVRSEQTDCEVELFAKALWAGIFVVEIPLSIDARTEALVPLRPGEIARFVATTTRLTCERLLLPAPLRATIHQRGVADLPLSNRLRLIFREAIVHHFDPPSRFAASVGLGVFFGIVPIWGFQLLAAAATAHVLGLSKPLVLAGTYVSSPPMVPLILYASLLLGHLMFHGQFAGLPRPDQLERSVLLRYLGEYLVGSVTLAVSAGLLSFVLAFLAARTVKLLRGAAS